MNVPANTVTLNAGLCSLSVCPEILRGLYGIECPQLAATYPAELADDLTDPEGPAELSKRPDSLRRWDTQSI